MSILSVDQISPIGSGTTITLNATEVKTGNEITVGTGASIFSPAGNTLTFGTNNEERIRIKNDGTVLIGDDNDGNAFSGGQSLVIGNTNSGTRSGITIVSNSAEDGGLYFSKGTSNDSVRGQLVYQHDSNGGYMRFYTNTNERLRLGSSGQFGIGGANYGTAGQVLTSQGSGSAVQWATPAAPVVLALGYSSDASDSSTTVNGTTLYAGSTLAMTRVSATSKYVLRIGAQIYRPTTSSRGYLRYQVKVNSGSYNTTPGDNSVYSWYVGDETHENYREVTMTYLSPGSVGDTLTFQVGYQNTVSQDDRFRWQIIQATEVSALTV